VSTPWGVEFNEEELVVFEFVIEVFVGEDKNAFVLGNLSQDSCDQ
jgi:hypothetical protein